MTSQITAINVVVFVVSAFVTWGLLEALQAWRSIKRDREVHKSMEDALRRHGRIRSVGERTPYSVEEENCRLMQRHLNPQPPSNFFEDMRKATGIPPSPTRRTATGRFAKGSSGNPSGRPKKTKD